MTYFAYLDEFGHITIGRRQPPPTIEIHRVCYQKSCRERQFPMTEDRDYFERRFRDGMSANLRAAGLHAEVFIWDDFHDRYLISNLIGDLAAERLRHHAESRQHHTMDALG